MEIPPILIVVLRAIQTVFSIIVLGLAAYIVSSWHWSRPHSVDFLLFTSIWSLLAIAFLIIIPNHVPALARKSIIVSIEALTFLFWFAAFVAVTVIWDTYRCGTQSDTCSAGIAALVFAAFTWLAFLATTVWSAFHVRDSFGSTTKSDAGTVLPTV